MTTAALVREVRRLGGELCVVSGGQVRCRVPPGTLTHEVDREVRRLKPRLLRMLNSMSAQGPPPSNNHGLRGHVRDCVQRIDAAYAPGLRDRLREHAPEALQEIEEIEDELNQLAVAGDYEGAALAALDWEATWVEAARLDLPDDDARDRLAVLAAAAAVGWAPATVKEWLDIGGGKTTWRAWIAGASGELLSEALEVLRERATILLEEVDGGNGD